MIEGKITRISGPIVYAEGLDGCGLYDVVDVGEKKLIGEIIRQSEGNATIQVYEDVSGMHVGERVVSNERPLSLKLGPGLVGTIYDGIQRPLKEMYESGGAFLLPGQRTDAIDTKRKWDFTPAQHPSDGSEIKEGSSIAPGMVLGTVQETGSVLHKIMVPPTIRGRVLSSFAGKGSYTVDEVIATTELDEKITMSQYWPLRKPRPFAHKLEVSQPLVTGLRVIDVFFPLSKGGTAAIPGGFGTGKTMTQHAIAKWCDADLIVYIGCGERGNEMTDVLTDFPKLIDPRTGRSLMERTILSQTHQICLLLPVKFRFIRELHSQNITAIWECMLQSWQTLPAVGQKHCANFQGVWKKCLPKKDSLHIFLQDLQNFTNVPAA